MDVDKLYEILRECTVQLRKGEEVVQDGTSTHVYMMPNESEADPRLKKIDCQFIVIGVDMEKAESRRAEFLEILDTYPDMEKLAGGPSYIEVGGVIGDQGAALMLFGLGEALELWTVITPKVMGIEGADADAMAGQGFVMMSGYHKEKAGSAT